MNECDMSRHPTHVRPNITRVSSFGVSAQAVKQDLSEV